MRVVILVCFLICSLCARTQVDSVLFTADMRLPDGIYLTYDDFRRNKSIAKAQVVSNLDKSQLEFLGKVVFEEKFSYIENGVTFTVQSKNVWGFAQNTTLYVNFREEFYRVPVFGSVSYLVANVTVASPGFYDPRFGMSTGGGVTKEIREFLMNFYDGIVTEFTLDEVEKLLARDSELFEEYKKLSRRKQKEQVYSYIRKYNTRHPVYFLR